MESEDIEDEGTNAEMNDIQQDPMDLIGTKHAVATKEDQITGEVSPAPVLEDVLMKPSHLHLPGYDIYDIPLYLIFCIALLVVYMFVFYCFFIQLKKTNSLTGSRRYGVQG